MEKYEARVYHILRPAIPVGSKTVNAFLAYVVDLFSDNLDVTADKKRYTARFQDTQIELYPSTLLLTERV